jgi:hypothetical protein
MTALWKTTRKEEVAEEEEEEKKSFFKVLHWTCLCCRSLHTFQI